MRSFKTQSNGKICEVPTTIIINKATFNSDYKDLLIGCFLDVSPELDDVKSYVNTGKLRKTLNLKGRGKILHILVRHMTDPLFINKANKDITYEYEVCIDSKLDGAYRSTYGFVCKNPVGSAIIVLDE
jgi:hypothetical protein